jgi:hypothetical protein
MFLTGEGWGDIGGFLHLSAHLCCQVKGVWRGV